MYPHNTYTALQAHVLRETDATLKTWPYEHLDFMSTVGDATDPNPNPSPSPNPKPKPNPNSDEEAPDEEAVFSKDVDEAEVPRKDEARLLQDEALRMRFTKH